MRQGDLVGLIELSRYAEKQLLSSLASSIDLGARAVRAWLVSMSKGVCVCVCVFEKEKGKDSSLCR